MRWITGFGRFWYDFIVGDSVVLAIGGPAALGVGYFLTGTEAAAEVLLPVVVVVTLAVSLRRR
jgi:hypothetical protein